MILRCNYEEIQALRAGAHVLLDPDPRNRCLALSPPGGQNAVQALLPQLDGDLSLQTLAEIREVEFALNAIVSCLRVEMDSFVIATHPADEGAVAAYFDFAHALAVLGRLQEMAREMEALIEVVTGAPATEAVAREFVFPD